MDLPDPLPDYTSSAGMRVTGWMELNRVAGAAGQTHPQYLVFGTHGPEGDACDFSTLRVFTWGAKRQRYETADVNSNFCGQMPVKMTPATQLGGDATFSFMTISAAVNKSATTTCIKRWCAAPTEIAPSRMQKRNNRARNVGA